jgi:hypothetical protein
MARKRPGLQNRQALINKFWIKGLQHQLAFDVVSNGSETLLVASEVWEPFNPVHPIVDHNFGRHQ